MTPEQDCYRCARYKSNTGDCTMHFIREETLKRFVLRRIFDVTAMFFEDIMSFQKAVYEQRFEEAEKAAKKRKREIAQAEKRITELDRIFKRIYEDDISGAISHERFLKLSAEYEAEQKELTEKVKADREMVSTYEQDKADLTVRGGHSEVCGDYRTDAHDCQRVCEEDYRPCTGQVQRPPAAENPDYLELRRGIETGRGQADH